MRSGVDLIAKERHEQINKHGFSIEKDLSQNDYEKLISATLSILFQNPKFSEPIERKPIYFYPNSWDDKYYERIVQKSRIEQLVIAGALIAAEIDRILYSNDPELLRQQLIKSITERLNGRQCQNPLTESDEMTLTYNGLVAAFVTPDNTLHFKGAYNQSFPIEDKASFTVYKRYQNGFNDINVERTSDLNETIAGAFPKIMTLENTLVANTYRLSWILLCNGFNRNSMSFITYDGNDRYCSGMLFHIDDITASRP
nr:hypothetical protein [uncultured Arsenicibacter sp.]